MAEEEHYGAKIMVPQIPQSTRDFGAGGIAGGRKRLLAQEGYTPMPFTPFTYSQTGAFMIPGCTPSDPLCLNMISH